MARGGADLRLDAIRFLFLAATIATRRDETRGSRPGGARSRDQLCRAKERDPTEGRGPPKPPPWKNAPSQLSLHRARRHQGQALRVAATSLDAASAQVPHRQMVGAKKRSLDRTKKPETGKVKAGCFATRCAAIAAAFAIADQSAVIAAERVINVLIGGIVGWHSCATHTVARLFRPARARWHHSCARQA